MDTFPPYSRRTTYVHVSDQYTAPLECTAMNAGLHRIAEAAGPSCQPVIPAWPATVAVVPVLTSTLRMRWLPLSAMYSRFVLLGWNARPEGVLNRAAVPMPSEDPGELEGEPATMSTVLLETYRTRTRWVHDAGREHKEGQGGRERGSMRRRLEGT